LGGRGRCHNENNKDWRLQKNKKGIVDIAEETRIRKCQLGRTVTGMQKTSKKRGCNRRKVRGSLEKILKWR